VHLVEAVRYKPEGRGFDSWWCHWNFLLTQSFLPQYCPWLDSASIRSEYHVYFLGVKMAGAWGWQSYRPHVPIVLKSGNLSLLEPSGPEWASTGIAFLTTIIIIIIIIIIHCGPPAEIVSDDQLTKEQSWFTFQCYRHSWSLTLRLLMSYTQLAGKVFTHKCDTRNLSALIQCWNIVQQIERDCFSVAKRRSIYIRRKHFWLY